MMDELFRPDGKRPAGSADMDAPEVDSEKPPFKKTCKNKMPTTWTHRETGEVCPYDPHFNEGCGPSGYATTEASTSRNNDIIGGLHAYNFTTTAIQPCNRCGGVHQATEAFKLSNHSGTKLESKCRVEGCKGYHTVSLEEHFSNVPDGPHTTPYDYMPAKEVIKIPYYCFKERKEGGEGWCNICNDAEPLCKR